RPTASSPGMRRCSRRTCWWLTSTSPRHRRGIRARWYRPRRSRPHRTRPELGLGDYVRKNGFRDVVLGLSGGIDSAFVATLAADALGPQAVRTVALPSPYSSAESTEDAREVARRLGVRFDEIRIDDVFKASLSAL